MTTITARQPADNVVAAARQPADTIAATARQPADIAVTGGQPADAAAAGAVRRAPRPAGDDSSARSSRFASPMWYRSALARVWDRE